MSDIVKGMARAICEAVGPEDSSNVRSPIGDWPAWQDWVPQARAALLWLADNVSDDMDDAMVASVFDAKLDMTKRDARKSALAAALRAAVGGGE